MKKITCYLDDFNNVWYINHKGLYRNQVLFDRYFTSRNSKIVKTKKNTIYIKRKNEVFEIDQTGVAYLKYYA